MRRFVLTVGVLSLLAGQASAFDWGAGKPPKNKTRELLRDLRSPIARVRRDALAELSRLGGAKRVKPFVLRALRDADATVQQVAANLAADHRFTEAIPILIGWISDWDDKLRIAAAAALGKIGHPSAIKSLVRALADPEPKVRLKMVEALGAIGHKSIVVPMMGRLEDTSSGVRLAAVNVLAQLADKRSVISLMGRLSDPAANVRAAAVRAIGRLRVPRASPSLTRLLRDANHKVVIAAITTLGGLRYRGAVEPLIDIFRSGHYSLRDSAAVALSKIGTSQAIRALVRALTHSTLRSAAKKALSASTKQDARHINGLLRDPRTPRQAALVAVQIAREARVRGAVPLLLEQLRLRRLPQVLVIEALGRIRDKRAQRPLLTLLDSPAREVRLAALRALWSIVDGRAAQPLLRRLKDPDRTIKSLAIRYLGRLRTRLATKALGRIALGRDRRLARLAAVNLGRIGDRRAVPTLLKLLASPRRELRRLAVQSLARIRERGSVRNVLRLCKRSRSSVRVACVQALGGLLRGHTDAQAMAYLTQVFRRNDHSLFLATLGALAAMNDARIPQLLIDRLPHLSTALRCRTVEALGNFPAARAKIEPVLVKLLSSKETRLQGAAAWSLAKLGASVAKKRLVAIARSRSGWANRINAAAALGRVHAASTRAALRLLATDADPYVRANAVLGLGYAGDRGATPLLLSRLRRDRSPWVRINAVRALMALTGKKKPLRVDGRRYASVRAFAAEMARADPDARLRTVVRRLAAAGLPPSSRPRRRWIGLYLLDRDRKSLRRKPFVLVTPGGWVKASFSDVRGQSWEERLPEGRCFVERPTPKRRKH